MAKLSPLMIAPPVIFAAFVVIAAFGMFRGDTTQLPSTRIGQPAPAITPDQLGAYPAVTPEMIGAEPWNHREVQGGS